MYSNSVDCISISLSSYMGDNLSYPSFSLDGNSLLLTRIILCLKQVLCVTVAALIHYFYLSSFCWMLMEGIMLYLLIIEVYNTELKLPLCYGFSLGESVFLMCIITLKLNKTSKCYTSSLRQIEIT